MKYINKFHGLSDIQLKNLINQYNLNDKFGGIFCKDTLPQLTKNKFYIVNMDNHNGGGTHWVCFHFNKPSFSIYFDSFGFIAPTEIENKIKPYIYSSKDIQDIDSDACGYYSIEFIKYMYNEADYKHFDSFLNIFSNVTPKNDDILHRLLL